MGQRKAASCRDKQRNFGKETTLRISDDGGQIIFGGNVPGNLDPLD